MSKNSRVERERLKKEYKEHYRKMREAKERLKQTQKKKNIVQALKNMDSSELMESFDTFLVDVKSKVAHAEARLDVALESLSGESALHQKEMEHDEAFNKANAKETLKQLKMEMGMLYSELEKHASSMNVDKTIGPHAKEEGVGQPSTSDQNNANK